MGWRGFALVALLGGCEATTVRSPRPNPPPAEVDPPQVEPRSGEPIVGDEAESEAEER